MDPRITRAIRELHRRFPEPLAIPALAADSGLSASRFRQLFAAQTGTTPGRYLQVVRLGHARLLIERTFLSIKDVMRQVGYHEPSHFSRDFRRHYGVAPSAVRGTDPATPLPSRDPSRTRGGTPPPPAATARDTTTRPPRRRG